MTRRAKRDARQYIQWLQLTPCRRKKGHGMIVFLYENGKRMKTEKSQETECGLSFTVKI
jgi:hypothetical protein